MDKKDEKEIQYLEEVCSDTCLAYSITQETNWVAVQCSVVLKEMAEMTRQLKIIDKHARWTQEFCPCLYDYITYHALSLFGTSIVSRLRTMCMKSA